MGAVVGAKLTPPSSDLHIVSLVFAARNSLSPAAFAPAPRQLSRGRSTVATWTGLPLVTPPPLPRLVTVTTAVRGPVLAVCVGEGETVRVVAVAATATPESPVLKATRLAEGVAASKPDPEIESTVALYATLTVL